MQTMYGDMSTGRCAIDFRSPAYVGLDGV